MSNYPQNINQPTIPEPKQNNKENGVIPARDALIMAFISIGFSIIINFVIKLLLGG